jgi:DNA-binding response OmpR family regulator
MRILVVEDDPRLAQRLARMLREERHQVEVVHDGQAAIASAGYGTFDSLIVDVLLPGLDGFGVCRWLREHGITTPILFLTALGDIMSKVQGLDIGADDYLTKPFAFAELLARLRALERRHGGLPADAAILRLGTLMLDLFRRQVQLGETRLSLTPREFALLEYLLRHPHQALTRGQILTAVWPSDTEVTLSLVDTYIHYLRTKLSGAVGAPQIRTVRSIGYELTMEDG